MTANSTSNWPPTTQDTKQASPTRAPLSGSRKDETCRCGCGSTKRHYARISIEPKPFMIACDTFFKAVWAGEN